MTSPDDPGGGPSRLDSLIEQGLSRPSGVRDQVAELGGTRAVADQLGRSERTVRRWIQRERRNYRQPIPRRGGAAAQFRQAVEQARSQPTPTVRDQIAELGGTRAAAQALGRSERTIRRWGQQGRVPPAAAGSFDQAIQRNRKSEDSRRGQIPGERDSQLRQGAVFKFSGVAGPVTDSSDDSIRKRTLTFPLSAEAMSDILDAFYTGGTEAAIEALGQALAAEYMGSPDYQWQFRSDRASTLGFLYNR